MKTPAEIKVLIVDDDPAFRTAMIFEFKRKGFQVFSSENGKQAFEFVQTNPIDVIISDIRMPNGDGIELLNLVKAKNMRLPIVLLVTGFAEITTEDASKFGAEALFSKPFDRKALLAAVSRLLNPEEPDVEATKCKKPGQVQLQFADSKTSMKVQVVSLNRTGMYVNFDETPPQINETIQFSFIPDEGVRDQEQNSIEGSGIVKWVRTQSTEGFPKGCGIDFSYLSEKCRMRLADLIGSTPASDGIAKNFSANK